MPLETYRRRRDFSKTPEPREDGGTQSERLRYVIHKHAARRLHYDLRLEVEGVLKSWAVPKGPSLDPSERRLAVEVEDHPLTYGSFEGNIPKGEYGAGAVIVWDDGYWEPEGDPIERLRRRNLKFSLFGRKLEGRWKLVRLKEDVDKGKREWLLIKHRDAHANPKADIAAEAPRSVVSGRTVEEVAEGREAAHPLPSPDEPLFEPDDLPGIRMGDPPRAFRPQLASASDTPPESGDWLHEIKYDGYRMVCHIANGQATLLTRSGQDWTERLGAVAAEAAALPVDRALLDGEVVMLRRDGTTDFQALQSYFKGRGKGTLAYILFDLPYLEGYDLTEVALHHRKRILQRLLALSRGTLLRFGDQIAGRGETVYEQACRLGTEGIVSKQRDAVYEQRRTATWRKTKCRWRQEFVIGGYAPSDKAPAGLRSLLVGYYDANGGLHYAGRVGTGFSNRMRAELRDALDARRQGKSPFGDPPRMQGLTWVAPELVTEVEFAEWTREGVLRQAAFKGLREDKPAREVLLEKPPGRAPAAARGAVDTHAPVETDVRLTNPNRILFPGSGFTKADLLRHYRTVAERMLPYLELRPLTLVRCPDGMEADCFYQKHGTRSLPEGLETLPIREKDRERRYLYITGGHGLMALAQISALEIHPWGSHVDDPDRPDTIVFDLDPDPGLAWEHTLQAAWYLRGLLQGAGLESFVKTSGGKGLHVQLPIRRGPDWPAVKAFAAGIARKMAKAHPERFTNQSAKRHRTGRIYVDYLRNARGATSVAPYSPRARHGAPLSMPVHWHDLSHQLGPDAFAIDRLPDHLLGSEDDPWRDYFRVDNSLP
ncbi:MAG: DNA ligase D [Desulfobacterales bacterium]